jgi:hypothetical protein
LRDQDMRSLRVKRQCVAVSDRLFGSANGAVNRSAGFRPDT